MKKIKIFPPAKIIALLMDNFPCLYIGSIAFIAAPPQISMFPFRNKKVSVYIYPPN